MPLSPLRPSRAAAPPPATQSGGMTVLRGDAISDLSHIRVAVNDLVAYEYLDKDCEWQWGLGTVASLPAKRVVQLLLWTGGDSGDLPPSTLTISPEERKKAEARLKELLTKVKAVREKRDSLNATLTVKQVEYEDNRREKVMDVDQAKETLQEARKEIASLRAEDWREIRSYRTPPSIVVLVMEAVMMVLGEKANTWEMIQRCIRRSDFAQQVASFDSAKIGEAIKKKVRSKYLSHPKFTYHDSMKGSRALGFLQKWVVAQVQTSNVQEGLVEYDLTHKVQKEEIGRLQNEVQAFQSTLTAYEEEWNKLRGMLEGQPVKIGGGGDSGKPTPPKETMNGSSNDQEGRESSVPQEHIHGTELKWRVTNKLIYVLRSSILTDYDKALSKEVRLTPEQVSMLKSALEKRMPYREQELRDAEVKRKLQEAVENLRGDNAELLKRLNDAESARHELEKEKEEREKELEALNSYIVNNDVPLLPRKTPRKGRGSSTPRKSARALEPKAREDLEKMVADLQDRLDRALHNNPTEAQVQLLEDDLKVTQDELREKKSELDNFRAAVAPHHFTSSGLKAAEESPEAQLERALEYIDDLEGQLQEMLDADKEKQQQQQKQRPSSSSEPAAAAAAAAAAEELREKLEQVEMDLTDSKRMLDDAETKLNDEIHAHNYTKDQLEDLKNQNEELWKKQEEAAKEKEAAEQALREKQGELQKLRDALTGDAKEAERLKEDLIKLGQDRETLERAANADRDARAVELKWLRDILEREAEKQRNQSKETKNTLGEVREMLLAMPAYCHLASIGAVQQAAAEAATAAAATAAAEAPPANGMGEGRNGTQAAVPEPAPVPSRSAAVEDKAIRGIATIKAATASGSNSKNNTPRPSSSTSASVNGNGNNSNLSAAAASKTTPATKKMKGNGTSATSPLTRQAAGKK